MALTATLYNFLIQLADMDRNVYADFELRMARQPSETSEFMLVRLLAYCLEFAEEGITLTEGVAAGGDKPALWVRDLTGAIKTWIEVGAPDAERVHRGSRSAERTVIYAHRDPLQLIAQLSGKKIYRGTEIPVYGFDRAFLNSAAALLQRRSKIAVSVTEQQLYLDVDGQNLSTPINEHRVA